MDLRNAFTMFLPEALNRLNVLSWRLVQRIELHNQTIERLKPVLVDHCLRNDWSCSHVPWPKWWWQNQIMIYPSPCDKPPEHPINISSVNRSWCRLCLQYCYKNEHNLFTFSSFIVIVPGDTLRYLAIRFKFSTECCSIALINKK